MYYLNISIRVFKKIYMSHIIPQDTSADIPTWNKWDKYILVGAITKI